MNILIASANLKVGGAQRVAANIAKYAPPDYRFVYQVFSSEGGAYEEDIIRRGDKIVYSPSPQSNLFQYIKSTASIIRKERIDIVHSHNMYANGILIFIAWILGVHGRISHSHTSKDEVPKTTARRLYKAFMRHLIRLFGTDYCACGIDAGRELYGQKWFDKHGTLIKNGIDIEKYRFSPEYSAESRTRYHLEEKFVIGHVGHYAAVKNQLFLLELLPAILRKRPNAALVMFGEGEMREALAEKIQSLGLEDSAILAGNTNEVHKVLSAFDVFVFPSLFEGTPLALIEAQANSLPCIASTNISPDAILSDYVQQISLENRDAWIQGILSASRDSRNSGPDQLLKCYETVEQSMKSIYRIYKRYERKTHG